MKKSLLILLSGVLLAGMLSCTSEPAVEPETIDVETRAPGYSFLDLSPEYAGFTYTGGTVRVGLVGEPASAERAYRVVSTPVWVTSVVEIPGGPVIYPYGQTTNRPGWIDRYYDITAMSNRGTYRSGEIILENAGTLYIIPVIQESSAGTAPITFAGINNPYTPSVHNIHVTASMSGSVHTRITNFEVYSTPDWIDFLSFSTLPYINIFADGMRFHMAANPSTLIGRTGNVVVRYIMNNKTYYQAFEFRQLRGGHIVSE